MSPVADLNHRYTTLKNESAHRFLCKKRESVKTCTFCLVPPQVVFKISFYHEQERVTNENFIVSLVVPNVHKFLKQVLLVM